MAERGDYVGAKAEAAAKAAKQVKAHGTERDRLLDGLLAIAANSAYENEDRVTVGDIRLAVYGKAGRPPSKSEVIDYTGVLTG